MTDYASRAFGSTGELARLVATTDWSRTPLGPIETWPASLRVAVSICLGSRHPIVLWWGPQRWMFYNDAYRPMLGQSKHPQFLGGSGRECWAEIWDVIGPMMDQVIATGDATWSEDLPLVMTRHGYAEETYFTFSYSPIRDETGAVHGIFNACTETTGRVLADRRLKTLRSLSASPHSRDEAARLAAEALGTNPRDVPFALVYLSDGAGAPLRLAGLHGLTPGTSACPATVDPNAPNLRGWPLGRALGSGRSELIEDLSRRFEDLPVAPWDEPPRSAIVLPLCHAGVDQPGGVLVLGISPRRAFDDDYRGFFELVAGQIATALGAAREHELEHERLEALAELDRAKTLFFSNVSHELRTPLTLILGPLEDCLAEADLAPPLIRQRLGLVHHNAVRLLKLVNALLDFSRVEAGRMTASFAPTELGTLTRQLASSFLSAFDKAGLQLQLDVGPLGEAAYVDRELWEKIVLNLVSNAFKFTLQGKVTVALVEGDGMFRLTIADTGVGIPEAEIPHVFDRFHRVRGTRGRTIEGTGIGLALVRELVKLHGGTIAVKSAIDQGTTFEVAIPKGSAHLPGAVHSTAGESPPSSARSSERSSARSSARTSPFSDEAYRWVSAPTEVAAPNDDAAAAIPRVLLADDNPDLRQYIASLLGERYAIRATSDGAEALAVARAWQPDLVLSDVMMPRLDGFGLLRALRADPATRDVPVILLSARAGEESAVDGLGAGADDYLVKPFSARELLARVRTHIELSRARRAWAAEIETANRELEAFSYSVSHDLRAPLRAIDGFSHALAADCGDTLGETGRHYLDRIRSGAHRMGELIDALLGLSRIHRSALSRKQIDLTALAGTIVEELRRREPDRAVDVVITPGLTVEGDKALVTIALENLLGNAWKFTSKRPRARIELVSEMTPHGRAYCVRDDGAGFDMKYAAKLFGPFQRLHRSSDFEGTGIGLATVQRIVNRHGGRIWAESSVGAGAAFYFCLDNKHP